MVARGCTARDCRVVVRYGCVPPCGDFPSRDSGCGVAECGCNVVRHGCTARDCRVVVRCGCFATGCTFPSMDSGFGVAEFGCREPRCGVATECGCNVVQRGCTGRGCRVVVRCGCFAPGCNFPSMDSGFGVAEFGCRESRCGVGTECGCNVVQRGCTGRDCRVVVRCGCFGTGCNFPLMDSGCSVAMVGGSESRCGGGTGIAFAAGGCCGGRWHRQLYCGRWGGGGVVCAGGA